MKNEELRELDAWIAEHVMGFTLNSGHPPHWYSSDSDRVYFVRLAEDDDAAIYWQPTTDPAAAMEVLKKCYDKCGMIDTFRTQIKPYRFGVTGKWLPAANYECEAEALELAICLFAKKLFTK